jgi:MYXO-CTERM domain-containing protein
VQVADVPYQRTDCDDQSYKTTKTDVSASAETNTPRWLIWGGALVAAGIALLALMRLRRRPGAA